MRLRNFPLAVKLGILAAFAAGLPFGPASLSPDPHTADASNLTEIKKLVASTPEPSDDFGGSVAVSADIAIVGARSADSVGNGAGTAYIFQRDEGGANNWGEVKNLTASDAQAGDGLGRSVAVSGDFAILGADGEDDGGANAGAAYVFQRNAGGADNWGEVKKLIASDAQAKDHFGRSVAVSPDTVVVGADSEGTGGSDAGAAYVFERDQGGADNWGQVKKLVAPGAHAYDRFGFRVAISGDTIIVSAHLEDAGGDVLDNSGAAYVFQRDQGGQSNWGQVTRLAAADAQIGDQFGVSVAISDDTVAVGAISEDGEGGVLDNFGAAYVFQRDRGGTDNWGEVVKLTASDAQVGDFFGGGVAVHSDTAIVGAWGEDGATSDVGTVYVFQRDLGGADNWGEVTKLNASDAVTGDSFGASVAVSGDTAVVGPWIEDCCGKYAAYVFGVASTDTDGDGCADGREKSVDETLGGLRDYKNPWDFYDVLGGRGGPPDGIIDLPNDILGVIQHYAPSGDSPYDVQFDRGPSAGPNPWNMTAPDGVIDLPNDILGVIAQYQHSCQ